jgi:hypothetical protein
VDCSTGGSANAQYYGQQPFNYSDDWDMSVPLLGNLTDQQNQSVNLNIDTQPVFNGTVNNNLGAESNYILAKLLVDADVRCDGKKPGEVAKLQLNGQDRFTEREGSYFDRVQPYQHHCRTPSTGINAYSFALRPEEHQPSGTCNFSRIDKATLQLTVSVNTVQGGNTAQVRVYALNYNVLRVMSGMGGLAYSN